MPSVVIPAYNEEAGIERCLRAVLSQGVEGLHVVVIANACADATAARARAVPVPPGATVLVLDTPEGGKANAINLGERALREAGADVFPRLFLDADIELAQGSLAPLLAEAARPGPRVVAATPIFDSSGATLTVRLVYAAERFNPYHREGAPNGSGTYCVNAEGRARWGDFPRVIADDGFVERQFARSERFTAAAARAVVRVPRTFADLRGIAGRKRLGTTELDAISPLRADQRAAGGTLWAVSRALLPRPSGWPALAVWIFARVLERVDSRRVARLAGQKRWQQDRSSRG